MDLTNIHAVFDLYLERKDGKFSCMVASIPANKIGKATGQLRKSYEKVDYMFQANPDVLKDTKDARGAFDDLSKLQEHYCRMADADFCIKVSTGIL